MNLYDINEELKELYKERAKITERIEELKEKRYGKLCDQHKLQPKLKNINKDNDKK